MGLFLFRFWPVLIPLFIYGLWLLCMRRRAHKAGEAKPRFRDGPWYWMVLSSLLIGIGCFMYISATQANRKGVYVPPHVENGVLIPGHVGP